MENPITAYIDKVCRRIKNKSLHQEIKLEIEDHLMELKENALRNGCSEEEALDQAFSQMGDPDEIGKQLHRTHRRKVEMTIILPVFITSIVGLLSMYFIQSYTPDGMIGSIFTNSLIYYLAGAALLAVFYCLDYSRILRCSSYIYAGAILILLLSLFIGVRAGGAPYLDIGIAMLDVSGISALIVGVALAGIFESWNWKKPADGVIGIGILVLPVVLLAMMGVVSYTLCLLICLVVMTASGAGFRQVTGFVTASAAVPVFLFAFDFAPFSYFAPEAVRNSVEISSLLSSAGWFGAGFSMNAGTLSEVHTDYIFVYVIHSFGWLAGISLLFLISLFVLRMIYMWKQVKPGQGKLAALVIAVVISLHFTISILTNMAVLPSLGIALPFMSFGGSSILIDMGAVGLFLNICHRGYEETSVGTEVPA
ncbi:UNVERIFIED_CONTAM: FtsW/RodA/SpoVE family cell cycle protein [Halobacillus marinus]